MPKFAGRLSLTAAVLATVAIAAACEDGDITGVLTPEDGFLQSMDGSVRATGGGRVDFPTGGPNKNKGTTQYQTWGFNIHDSDGTGPDGPKGRLQVVDHRENMRGHCGGNPCEFHSIEITTLGEATQCIDGGGAPIDGGVRIEGEVEERNTNARYLFELVVCDNGEPGSKRSPRDRFEFLLPTLTAAPAQGDANGQYCLHEAPGDCEPTEEDGALGAQLTGGNIQSHG